MTSVDFLAHYDPCLPLKLSCDASSYGLRCLSTTLESGEEHPIVFASRVVKNKILLQSNRQGIVYCL